MAAAASSAVDHSDRLRLSILDVQGSKPERFAWEDSEGRALEAQVTDIATELVTTAEINYRDACVRRHLWISEKREALREHLEEERRATEVARRTQAVAVARARVRRAIADSSSSAVSVPRVVARGSGFSAGTSRATP